MTEGAATNDHLLAGPAAGEPPASPLVSSILSGAAPLPVRLAAARGALPLSRPDLMRVLVALATAGEPEVREPALRSLEGWPAGELAGLAADPGTPADVLIFLITWPASDESVLAALFSNASTPTDAIAAAARTLPPDRLDILLAAQTQIIQAPRLLDAIDANPALTPLQRSRTEEIRRHFLGAPAPRPSREPAPSPAPSAAREAGEQPAIQRPAAGLPARSPAGAPAEAGPEGPPPPDGAGPDAGVEEIDDETLRTSGVYQRILKLNVTQKIALATKGDREERLILIRDSNRSVQEAVINSPKLTEQEVETIAKMRNVKDNILRSISARRDWMKSYAIVKGLANNPRTPLPVALELIKRLAVQDLKTLITDRNLPDTLRRMGKKLLDQRLSRTR